MNGYRYKEKLVMQKIYFYMNFKFLPFAYSSTVTIKYKNKYCIDKIGRESPSGLGCVR